MSFSYSNVWDETVRTLRAHSALLLAVAGVFLFLPSLIAGYAAPPPQEQGIAAITGHYRENFWVFFIVQLIAFIGNLALLILVLDDRHPTVGGSIQAALMMLPAYFIVSLLSGFMLVIGLFLLVLPFFYLVGRLSAVGPALVAEGKRNPFEVIRRSFEITKGNGWAIVGLILLVFVAFYILMLAITLVFGSILLLVDRTTGSSVGAFLLLVLNSAVGAAFNTVLMVLVASIYRRLTNGAQRAAAPTSGI